MLPVLSKIGTIFEYIYDGKGRPTGKTIDKLIINPTVYRVTAKFDGTCCYIKDGKIFARQDVKKSIDNAPVDWFPTAGTEPDKGGHIIGFRPLDQKKGDKWHFQGLDETDKTKARFLEYDKDIKSFCYIFRSITEFNGQTAELVGPHVNGNKHHLDKHAYIIHGNVEVEAPWKSHNDIDEWFKNEGNIYEGIVIHDLENKKLYKCHRGHLGESFIWSGNPLPIKNS
jgi:hypothetical protein